MQRTLILGVVVSALTILGTTGTAEAGRRCCGYGYSIGSYAVPTSSATYYHYPANQYYYSRPYFRQYGYYYPGFTIGFGHYGGGYYGGHYGFGHYGGGHYGGGHYGGHYGGGYYGGHYGGGHYGGGHYGGHH